MATPPMAVSISKPKRRRRRRKTTRLGPVRSSVRSRPGQKSFPFSPRREKVHSPFLSFGGGGVYLSSLIPRDTAAVVTLRPSSALPPVAERSVCWPAAWHLAAAAKAAAKAAAAAGVHPTSVPLCLGGPDPQGVREGRGRARAAMGGVRDSPESAPSEFLHSSSLSERDDGRRPRPRLLGLKGLKGERGERRGGGWLAGSLCWLGGTPVARAKIRVLSSTSSVLRTL